MGRIKPCLLRIQYKVKVQAVMLRGYVAFFDFSACLPALIRKVMGDPFRAADNPVSGACDWTNTSQ